MPKIGPKRTIRIPKGICDDWWKNDIFFSFSGNIISINKDDSFDKDNFYLIGKSYLDSKGSVSIPEEALSILDCDFGNLVIVYKSSKGIFIEKAPRHGQG